MNAPFPLCAEQVSVADLRDPGEIARIEGFVAELGGSPFHRPAWLQAVERGTGQKAAGLVSEKRGALTGWLPLTEVHSPLFGRALVSSGFAVDGGVLAESDKSARRLCRAAAEMAVRGSCSSVELRGGALPPEWQAVTGKHLGFVADLAQTDEAQLLAVPRKQRAEVRKSLDIAFNITVGSGEADRTAHYAVYSESVRNLGTPVFPRSLFDAVLDRFGADADILTVRHDGAPVASVLSLYHGDTVMPYWGGGTQSARVLRANERMYFELMLHARKRGYDRFDFGRSKVGSGPASYKKNWGFEAEPLVYGSWTAPGVEPRNIDPTSDIYSARIDLWKKLPLPLANLLGPHIARGLA